MLRIILGSYERLLYGLDAVPSTTTDTKSIAVTQSFTYPAHISAIKSLAVTNNAKILATGASDEHVKLYSLARNREIGTLFHHTGSITALDFHSSGYLFTASEDADIAIVRVSDWEVLKVLKGHTTAIQSISIHPTGKLLLSVSIDGYLRTWDTSKASCAYTLKMPLPRPVKVQWSPCGLFYAVLFETGVAVFEVTAGKEVWRGVGLGRLTCMEFVVIDKEPILLIAGDAKTITAYAVKSQKVLLTLALTSKHVSRIKDMSAATLNGTLILVTCSSDGGVYGWDLKKCIAGAEVGDALMFEFEAKCRLTCCVAVYQIAGKVRSRGDGDDSGSDEEEVADLEEEAEPAPKVAKVAKGPSKVKGRVVVSYEGDEVVKDAAESVEPVSKGKDKSLTVTKNKAIQKKKIGGNKKPFGKGKIVAKKPAQKK
ncbi:p21-activated protein kinase-interacting protein 1-like protein [Chytriomyces hyalinus]|nr:p21-activated protein kinase-interacting protein 1-like protein [Chytriomyces hyalinus]